jgi:YHS domain-containing protein
MKSAIIVAASLLIVSGCGADQTASDSAPAQGSAQTAQVKPYPVDWCIVTGEKLGSMGDPVSKTYQGQEVKFCCKYCIPEFEKTPAAFLARIDSAATGLLQQPEHDGTH